MHSLYDQFLTIKSLLELNCILLAVPFSQDSSLKAAASTYAERVFALLEKHEEATLETYILGGFLTLLGLLFHHKYALHINEDDLWGLVARNCHLSTTSEFDWNGTTSKI